MPHVVLNDVNKLKLLWTFESGRFLSMGFHSWDLYEYPLVQSTTSHSWAVKAAIHLEKPRYVFTLQKEHTGRKNAASQDCTRFDHCNLSNVKIVSEFKVLSLRRPEFRFREGPIRRFVRHVRQILKIVRQISKIVLSTRWGRGASDIGQVYLLRFAYGHRLRQNETVKSDTVALLWIQQGECTCWHNRILSDNTSHCWVQSVDQCCPFRAVSRIRTTDDVERNEFGGGVLSLRSTANTLRSVLQLATANWILARTLPHCVSPRVLNPQ